MIEIPHPENSNHNGGQLQFLGDLLYFGTGDGGSAGDPPNNAQNRESLLGKLLRIDPRASGGRPYSVPASNPFVGRPGRDEIYSYGLRNPFRFSFDTVTAEAPRIAIGDVGQNRFEEVDYTTVAGGIGRELRLGRLRGLRPLPRRKQRHARPGRDPEADLRLPPQPRRLLDHRRLRRRRPLPQVPLQALRLHRLLRRELRSLVPHLGRASGDRKLGVSVEEPGLSAKTPAAAFTSPRLPGPSTARFPLERLQLADQPRA